MSERRWIPEKGTQAYKDRIHKESKLADEHKNLPFTFSKPRRAKATDIFVCDCGHTFSAPKGIIMFVCSNCKQLKKVNKED